MKIAELQSAIVYNKAIVVLVLATFVAGVAVGGIVLVQRSDPGGSESYPEEALELSDQHVWCCDGVNQNGWAEAAMSILNTGETDVTLRKITVRGVECSWNNVFYWKTDTGPISDDLEVTSTELSGSSFDIIVDGVERIFQQATTGLVLKPDWIMVLYLKDPINLTSYDGGESVVISIFTNNDIYFEETYLEGSGTFTFMQTEQVSITNMAFNGASNASDNTIVLSLKNTGSSKVTLTQVSLNGAVHTVVFSMTAGELDAAGTGTATLTNVQWVSGNTYRVILQSSTGTNVASYEKKAS